MTKGVVDRWACLDGSCQGTGAGEPRARLRQAPRWSRPRPRWQVPRGRSPRDGEQTVGQVHPNHPAALREGMRMGFDSPGQLSSLHAILWKRTQVQYLCFFSAIRLFSNSGQFVFNVWAHARQEFQDITPSIQTCRIDHACPLRINCYERHSPAADSRCRSARSSAAGQ